MCVYSVTFFAGAMGVDVRDSRGTGMRAHVWGISPCSRKQVYIAYDAELWKRNETKRSTLRLSSTLRTRCYEFITRIDSLSLPWALARLTGLRLIKPLSEDLDDGRICSILLAAQT